LKYLEAALLGLFSWVIFAFPSTRRTNIPKPFSLGRAAEPPKKKHTTLSPTPKQLFPNQTHVSPCKSYLSYDLL